MNYNEPRVLDQLVRCGVVFTVRHYPAEAPFIRAARKGRQFLGFNVQLETVTRYEHLSSFAKKLILASHVDESGFLSVDDWLEAIERQHSQHKKLWLLKATRVQEHANPQDS